MDNVKSSRSWLLQNVVLAHGKKGEFDETAIKDPSVVYFEDNWHIFYTARGNGRYSLGYTSSPSLSQFASAKRYQLNLGGNSTRIDCAPQVFYFTPHKLWYLIFQITDSNYQPAFSTNATVHNPDSWKIAQELIHKDTTEKWIDFWVICDTTNAYIFYTQEHNDVYVRSTRLEDFPCNWGEATKVFSGVHEAVHIYSLPAGNRYVMIYELSTDGVRSFGIASAEHLPGPWEEITSEFASSSLLRSEADWNIWTEMVSHGEAIRIGYDEKLEIESENGEWLIQGILKREFNVEYPELPWKLGIIARS